jgi:hypothetical protein
MPVREVKMLSFAAVKLCRHFWQHAYLIFYFIPACLNFILFSYLCSPNFRIIRRGPLKWHSARLTE